MTVTTLLERDVEAAALGRALEATSKGAGRLCVIQGPAGIGKSTLLDEVRRQANDLPFRVRIARGAELEREISLGVVRQLVEEPVRRATDVERATLLAGAAALAAPVLFLTNDPVAASTVDIADRRAPVIHGLYWLTANLAAHVPLLLAVDDAQWADAASLRFLVYLSRRIEGLPILVVATVRTGERVADADALAELTLAHDASVLNPQPLTGAAVRSLIRGAMHEEPDETFVTACRDATGGVPFLLRELLRELAAAAVSPTAASADSVTQVTSQTVAHATLLRLARLSPAAAPVAKSVAVLGRDADPRRVARISDVPQDAVLRARDALVQAGVLRAGPPMRFEHPIVMASVYEAMGRGERSLAHAAAAQLLAEEGGDVEAVASHLLATEPGIITDATAALYAAAGAARARGAPESAVAYLQRGLREQVTTVRRAQLLHALAEARSVTRDPRSIDSFREALRLSGEDRERGQIALDLVETLMVARQWDAALADIDRSLDELGSRDAETSACLEVFRAQIRAYDARFVEQFESDQPHLAAIARREGRAGRLMASLLAACAVARGAPAPDVVALSRRALEGGDLMRSADAESWGPYAAAPLAWLGIPDEALAAADEMREAAQQRGSVYGYLRGTALHALALGRLGDLRGAEGDVRAAFELAREGDLMYGALLLLCWSVDALLERPQLDDVAATLEATDVTPELDGTYLGAWLLETRGRLRLSRGRREAACDDLRRCGALMTSFRTFNPILSPWRSAYALAMPENERATARRLVDEEIELAKAAGTRAAEAVATRTAGLLERGEAAVELLRQSHEIAVQADAPLEAARALVALGATMRRSGQRAAAAEPLRQGLDAAHRCGADRLAQSAETELRTLGHRPRRRALFGVDALTPSELRVAREAARGMSNREIAQSMFVTTKTIETQLSSAYQKLAIRGRDALAAALEPSTPD